MIVYYILFGLLLFFAIVELCGYKWNNSFRILLTLFLVCLSGFRYEIGNDYSNYVSIFNHAEDSFRIEPGFIGLISFVKALGGNAQAMFLLSAFLTIVPLAYVINRVCPKYFCAAIATYVFSYIYFEGMNTVRQAISMSIMFYAFYDYLAKNKNWNYILLALIASLFHYSAVIVAVAGWFVMKFTGKNINAFVIIIALIVSFILGYYIQYFTDQISLVAVLLGRGDSVYLDNIEQRGVSSGLFHYVLNIYALCFLIISYLRRRYLSDIDVGIFKLFFAAIITYNFFINFYIGLRFYWYFYLFIILTIPTILSLVKKNSRALLFITIISVFVAYTFLSLGTAFYSPYKFSFDLLAK